MKSVFIVYAQSLTSDLMTLLDRNNVKGYSKWEDMTGRGSVSGEPHLGSHAWPAKNSGIIAMVDDGRVDHLLDALKELDERTSMQGLRAYVWNIERHI